MKQGALIFDEQADRYALYFWLLLKLHFYGPQSKRAGAVLLYIAVIELAIFKKTINSEGHITSMLSTTD